MNLQHASYAFPSERIPLVDLGLTLLLLLLLLALVAICRGRRRFDPLLGGFFGGFLGSPWRLARRASAGPRALLAALFALGVLSAAACELALGPPLPRVVDEHSYLYAAATYAHGDLTNETPAHPEHFRAMHVLTEPTSQSKYPPAQGLSLALGCLLGRPSAALWIQCGLLTAAVAWLLRFFMPPPWPLFGALFVLFRVGLGSYWNQSYWGGSVAMIGGILVLGAGHLCTTRPSVRSALLFGLGLAILANSRPFEGLLFSLPIALFVGVWLLTAQQEGVGRRLRVGLALGLVLAATAVAMLGYNAAVTGDPLRLPHTLYTEREQVGWSHFLWGLEDQGEQDAWWLVGLRQAFPRLAFTLFFFAGLAGTCLALLARADLRRRGVLAGALGAALLVAGQATTTPWFAHYAAPVGGFVVLLAFLGLRRLVVRLEATGRPGRLLPTALVLAQLVLCLVQLPAHRPDLGSTPRLRAAVEQWLLDQPGRDLVLLCDAAGRSDWLYNQHSFATAEILWAAELSGEGEGEGEGDEALLATFADRTVWHLSRAENGGVVLARTHGGPTAFHAP